MWFGFWVLKLAFTGLVLLGPLSHKSCILPCRLHNKGVVSLQNLHTADTVFRTLWYDAQSHICTHVIFSFVKDFSSPFVVGAWYIFFTYASWWLHSLTHSHSVFLCAWIVGNHMWFFSSAFWPSEMQEACNLFAKAYTLCHCVWKSFSNCVWRQNASLLLNFLVSSIVAALSTSP